MSYTHSRFIATVIIAISACSTALASDRRWIGYQFDNASNFPARSSFANNFAWSNSTTPGATDNAILGEGHLVLPNPRYPLTPYGPYNIFFGQFDEQLFAGSTVSWPATDAIVQDFVVKGGNTWRLDMGPGWRQDPNSWGTHSTGTFGSLTATGEFGMFGSTSNGPIVNVVRGELTAGRVKHDTVNGLSGIYPTLNVTGPGTRVHDTAALNGGIEVNRGHLNIADGGLVDSDTGWVQVLNDSSMTVDGVGSRFKTRSPVEVSDSGNLTITGGGLVEVIDGEFWCGFRIGSNATTTISGLGSRLEQNSAYPAVIGRQGDGHLTVQSQASAKFSALHMGLYGTTGAGTTTISSGGTIETSGEVGVGSEEHGSLTMTQATFNIGTHFQMGGTAASTGTATLLQSKMSIGALMRIAVNGRASMDVLGGSEVRCNDAKIGETSTASGTLTISGAGSLVHVDATMFVGGWGTDPGAGTAHVIVRDGGRLEVGDFIYVKQFGTLSGDGIIAGDIINNGTISPGNSPGVLTVDGHLRLQSIGALLMEIGGPTPGTDFDQLIVTGDTTLGGTLTIDLIDGFVPSPGSSFDLLVLSHVMGGTAFTNVVLPPGVAWDTSELASGGTLRVVPEPSAIAVLAAIAVGTACRRPRSTLAKWRGRLTHRLSYAPRALPVTALIIASPSGAALGQIVINNFESATAGTGYGFRVPGFSGSTDDNLNGFGGTIAPNVQVATSVFPPGLSSAGARVGHTEFQFVDASLLRWLRHTTFNAAGLPNPVIDLSRPLEFDIWTSVPLRVSILVREADGAIGPVASNGGTIGPIETVGATSIRGVGDIDYAPVGQLIAAGNWQTISIDFAASPVIAYAAGTNGVNADGVLNPPHTPLAVLESIAFTSEGSAGPYSIYYDNFRQVPEPTGAMALVTIGLGLGFRFRRCSR